jgi:6-pyruvoyltetrahydropterin/6-carboxytetrahydropterin synthase
LIRRGKLALPTAGFTRLPTDIYKLFHIEAAHRLPNVPAGHKCARLHVH